MISSYSSPVVLAARMALCAGWLSATPQAWAQAAPSSATDNTLAEVTVYGSSSATHEEPPSEATRRYKATFAQSATGMALSAQETPQALTVLTRQQMEDHQLDTLARVLDSTPGVSSSAIDRGRQRFSARGFAIDKYQVDGLSVNWSGPWAAGEALADTVLYDAWKWCAAPLACSMAQASPRPASTWCASGPTATSATRCWKRAWAVRRMRAPRWTTASH